MRNKCEGHWINASSPSQEVKFGSRLLAGSTAVSFKLTIIQNDCVHIRVNYSQELTTSRADQGSALIIQCINTERAPIMELVSSNALPGGAPQIGMHQLQREKEEYIKTAVF